MNLIYVQGKQIVKHNNSILVISLFIMVATIVVFHGKN